MNAALDAPGTILPGAGRMTKKAAKWYERVDFGRELLEHMTGAAFRLLHTFAWLEACDARDAVRAGRPRRPIWIRQGPTSTRWSYTQQRASKSLAELCGVTRQHVCLMLGLLERFGLVEVIGGDVDAATGKRKPARDRANRFVSLMYRLTARARRLLRLNDRPAAAPEYFRVMDTPHGIVDVPFFSTRATDKATAGGTG